MTSEEEKWRDERAKVLDQWCEIELKFRDAPPDLQNATSTEKERGKEKQTDWTEMHYEYNDPLVERIINESYDQEKDFPFAVVGINITSILISKLKTEDLDELSNSVGGLLRAMDILYRGCFIDYCKQWKENSCTIKDFQNVFNRIKTTLKKNPWKFMKPYSSHII